MGWKRTRDDVGARAANGGDKVLWGCIVPYEALKRENAGGSRLRSHRRSRI